ncbi:MAG TPA: DUF695 domain-containing protein [Steroidobacter sp.]|uniref:DUF695 domain-containing protein n=1 Tax=Steroidobacter sp. TaxID=1978227 RepID=UPI002ED7F81C
MMHDRKWVLAERKTDEGLSLIRIMELDASFAFQRYPERLNVIWAYRDTGPDDTPAEEEQDAMGRFESRICEYIEATEQALLCVVFTEPGYREFVFYSSTVESFLEALSEIPQEESGPYPIQIHHESDSKGEFYKSYAKKLLAQRFG